MGRLQNNMADKTHVSKNQTKKGGLSKKLTREEKRAAWWQNKLKQDEEAAKGSDSEPEVPVKSDKGFKTDVKASETSPEKQKKKKRKIKNEEESDNESEDEL